MDGRAEVTSSVERRQLSAKNQGKTEGNRQRPGRQDFPRGSMAHRGQSSGVHLEPPSSFLPCLGSQHPPPNPSADLWDLFQPQPHTEEQLEEALTKRKVIGCTCPAPATASGVG